MKAGAILKRFKEQHPKQSKATGMLYSGRMSNAPISRITVHHILVSDDGQFELKNVTIGHPVSTKTPAQWAQWLDRYYRKILIAVVDSQERERGNLWKVRANLGWSADAPRRKNTKMAKRKRHKATKKRR